MAFTIYLPPFLSMVMVSSSPGGIFPVSPEVVTVSRLFVSKSPMTVSWSGSCMAFEWRVGFQASYSLQWQFLHANEPTYSGLSNSGLLKVSVATVSVFVTFSPSCEQLVNDRRRNTPVAANKLF